MKKMMFTLLTMLTIAVSANAMSYEQARNEALFLTDKMAYELNLTDAQYEAAYEINLDYLMRVTSHDDVFGIYWEHRNLDLSYILYSWQWEAFRAATYFYRPLYWEAGFWHFAVYAHYPRRDFFYFGRPHFYASYRGGHSWHMNGGRSFYEGRREHFRPDHPRDQHFGMRNSFDRGDFRNGRGGSSTRVTGRGNDRPGDHNSHNGNLGGGRPDHNSHSGNFSGGRSGNDNHSGNFGGGRSDNNSHSGNFGGGRSDNNNHSGNFGGGRSDNNSHSGTPDGGRSDNSGHFSTNRSVGSTPSRSSIERSTPNRNIERSTPSRSVGSSTPSRSVGSSTPSRSVGSSTPSRSVGSSTPSRSVGSSTPSRSVGSSSSGGTRSGGSHGGSRSGGSRR
jgi:hypothetical protein